MANTNPGGATTATANNTVLSTSQAVRLLGVARSVNANTTGDSAVIPIQVSATYSVKEVVMTNGSISLTTAAAGVFTAPNAGGTAIVANAALATITGPTIVFQRTVATTATQTSQNLYVNFGTAQGAAATVDCYVYGYDFTTP